MRKRNMSLSDLWLWLQSNLDKSQPPRAGMDSPCWEWTGPKERKGYGRFDVHRRPILAHRFAWWATHGAIPDLFVLHRCDNPPCCNPEHLFLGTYADNNADRVAKGRNATGAKIRASHPLNRLTPDLVREIRRSADTSEALAARIGITATAIRDARTGRTWGYIV